MPLPQRSVNGREWGEWKFWDTQGRLTEKSDFKSGERDGHVVIFYDNGKVQHDGWIHQGKQDSVMHSYYRTGQVMEEGKQEQESESESGNEYDSYTEGPRGDHNGGESESREFNLDDYMQQDSYNYKEKLPSSSDDDDDYEAPIVQMQSFSESLNEQLDMLVLDERQRIIADHLIGSIDEDGYLRRPIPAIVNDMSFRYNFRAAPVCPSESVRHQVLSVSSATALATSLSIHPSLT